jgi:hypothetical protein
LIVTDSSPLNPLARPFPTNLSFVRQDDATAIERQNRYLVEYPHLDYVLFDYVLFDPNPHKPDVGVTLLDPIGKVLFRVCRKSLENQKPEDDGFDQHSLHKMWQFLKGQPALSHVRDGLARLKKQLEAEYGADPTVRAPRGTREAPDEEVVEKVLDAMPEETPYNMTTVQNLLKVYQ